MNIPHHYGEGLQEYLIILIAITEGLEKSSVLNYKQIILNTDFCQLSRHTKYTWLAMFTIPIPERTSKFFSSSDNILNSA